MPDSDFKLTISLNSLNHLGINLYSNVPAVISEVVANSWDADAEVVEIEIDSKNGVITIRDDGCGMTKEECNKKYLNVGYRKRDLESVITPKLRHIMGRKGLGKLSLFSIAKTIEVQTVKKDKTGKVIDKNGFVMDADYIKRHIEKEGEFGHDIPLPPLEKKDMKINEGTRIVIRNLKKDISITEKFLRRRLARRFSIIGDKHKFNVKVNGKPITVEDREFFNKIQYLWYIGDYGKECLKKCKKVENKAEIDGVIDDENGYKIEGWVGTFDARKSIEKGNNTIIVLSWGKTIHEDILKDIEEGGIYSKYVIGELKADFLDFDELIDIATSDRQNVIENDPRFIKLKDYVHKKILKVIESKWTEWRTEDAEKSALENVKIKEWFNSLGHDNKKYARRLFQKIESFPISDTEYKKELYKHGILAFENLALRDNLSALEKIDTEKDFETFIRIFSGMDQLEAMHYYQILKIRLGVLKKFDKMIPTAKEKVIQKEIFEHLWLLDPSWERASTNERIEETMKKEFGKITEKLTPEEKAARLDIRYRTAAGKHIIIELKKYDVKIKNSVLLDQITKYRNALEKCLKQKLPGKEHLIEIICILGSPPLPINQDERNRRVLDGYGARYITYDELIEETKRSYKDYLEKQHEIDKIQEILKDI